MPRVGSRCGGARAATLKRRRKRKEGKRENGVGGNERKPIGAGIRKQWGKWKRKGRVGTELGRMKQKIYRRIEGGGGKGAATGAPLAFSSLVPRIRFLALTQRPPHSYPSIDRPPCSIILISSFFLSCSSDGPWRSIDSSHHQRFFRFRKSSNWYGRPAGASGETTKIN